MKFSMKKVTVLLADGFEEIEALTVVDLLRRAKVYVDTVSITDDYTVRGAHGIPVQTEDLITEIDFKESDMIVLPGGMPGTTNLNAYLTGAPVATDENIITSQGVGTAIDFALKLIEVLISEEKAVEIADSIVYQR